MTAFEDFATCPPEPSGLHEVTFTYDDEQDYIALALELEYKFLKGGTSIFAHPVVVSVLVDQGGIVQGRRIVTDNRISDRERRTAVTLMRNFKARYSPLESGLRTMCRCAKANSLPGTSSSTNCARARHPTAPRASPSTPAICARRASKRSTLETQTVNKGYFQSQTRYEEVLAPYSPSGAP